MRSCFAILLAACLAAAPVFASAEDAPFYPIPPKPDFSSMTFLVGSWSCSTKSERRPAAVKSVDTYSIDPSGYYLVYESKSEAVPWAPFAQDLKSMITYDPEIKMWASEVTSTFGDYGLSMSSGWVDGKLVWHALNNTPYLDVASNSDLTITKVSETKTTSASAFKTKSGKAVSVNGTCTKSP